MPIQLSTLGRLRCRSGDTELKELPAQRLRCAVLLYLALEQEVTREAAASLLWPERDDERARHALSQKLYELRQALGDAWLHTQSERMRVTAEVQVDAHQFVDAVHRGALEDALALYQGDFLAGFFLPESKSFETWVDGHRSRLARLHRRARAERIDQCVSSGDLEAAVAHARRWIELEPHEDDAHHRLIELLAAGGQRAEAIRQYESYERALQADELQPLDHTRELIARVRQSSVAPAGAGSKPPASRAPVTRASKPHFTVMMALLAAVVLGVTGWWTVWHDRDRSVRARSIAVLPFLNLSTHPDSSVHLSDGIADELIIALSHTDSLQVAARTSSFRFKNKDVSIQAIGDSLDVALILEGSVRREGNRLRIGAQLISVADGYQLWSEAFEREETDLLSVQQEMARAIVDALKIRLADPQRERLAVGGTHDTRAYDLFLRGRHLLHRGTRPAVRTSISYFDSAIARDPNYALAYANRAEASVIGAATRELPHAEALRDATRSAQRAIELAPSLSEAHAALGRAELELWNWSAAEREAVLAIQLDPRNAAARATYSRLLMLRGRMEAAVREAEIAARLEPLSAIAATSYGEALRAARKFELSARVYRKALELEPDLGRQNLAKVYIELAMYDSALAQFRAALAAGAPRVRNVDLLWMAYIHARAGRRDLAMPLFREFQDRQPQGPNAYMFAALHVALGDHTRAFQLMESGVTARSQPAWRQLPWDPIWDPVRKDERFARLLRDMGL